MVIVQQTRLSYLMLLHHALMNNVPPTLGVFPFVSQRENVLQLMHTLDTSIITENVVLSYALMATDLIFLSIGKASNNQRQPLVIQLSLVPIKNDLNVTHISGGSRISPRWGRQPSGWYQQMILGKFPQNCMQLKEFGSGGCTCKILLGRIC